MKLIGAVAMFFCCWAATVNAQYSQLLHKPHSQQKEILSVLYYSASQGEMSLPALEDTLAGMRELGIREKDPNLIMEADLLEAFYKVRNGIEGVETLIRVQQESEEKGFLYIASRAANAISGVYWEQMEFEKSIRWHLLLDELISVMDIADFPDKAAFLQQIGNDFYFFGDFEKAISYFKRVVDLPLDDFYIYAYRHSLNNLGLSYRELGKPDSSDYAFDRLLAHADSTSDQWVGIASGNLGYNHYLRREFEEAIPLLKTDIRIAEEFGDYGLAAGSSTPLADIYTQQAELDLAKTYIDKAYGYIIKSQSEDRLRYLFPVISKWESAKGNSKASAEYLDSAIAAIKKYNKKFSALQLVRANQEMMASRNEKTIQELNVEAARNKLIRTFILTGLGIVLIGFVVVYQVQNKRIKAEQKLKAKELKQQKKITEQAEKLQWMMKELHHRVKNNLQIISSLLNLQSYRIKDEESQTAMRESQLRVQAMSLMHQRLYQVDDVSLVNFKLYLTDLAEILMKAYGYVPDDFDLTIDVEKEMLDVDTVMPMGLLVNEIITNAFKYAYKEVERPALHISLTENSNQLKLDISDNGPGMEASGANKDGFGKKLIAALSKQLKATYQVKNEMGTSYSFIIPINSEKAA